MSFWKAQKIIAFLNTPSLSSPSSPVCFRLLLLLSCIFIQNALKEFPLLIASLAAFSHLFLKASGNSPLNIPFRSLLFVSGMCLLHARQPTSYDVFFVFLFLFNHSHPRFDFQIIPVYFWPSEGCSKLKILQEILTG